MSFSNHKYPASFGVLRQEIRQKAIEIANVLIKKGFEEKIIETVAISNAKLWVCFCANEPEKRIPHVHLIPHPKGWALIAQDASVLHLIAPTKSDGLNKSRSFAKNEKLKLYIHSLWGNIHDSESFCVNKPRILSLENLKKMIPDNRREAFKKSKWVPVKS